MDTPSEEHRPILRSAVAGFVRDDILKSNPDAANGAWPFWAGGRWNKVNRLYIRATNRLAANYCYAIKPPVQSTSYLHVPFRKDPVTKRFTQEGCDHVVQTCVLPGWVRNALDNPPARKRVLVLYMIQSFDDALTMTHASAIVFDLKNRKQIVYDSQSGSNNVKSLALDRHQFHPGYDLVPTATRPSNMSLQTRLETQLNKHTIDSMGACGVLLQCMLATSYRFNIWNPILIQDDIYSVLRRNHRLSHLISWYYYLYASNDSEAKKVKVTLPNSRSKLCQTFSASSRRFCSRKSCSADASPWRAMCWQHRWIVRNTNSQNRKCVAAQVACA